MRLEASEAQKFEINGPLSIRAQEFGECAACLVIRVSVAL
jgi:hypothetical protein